MFNFRKKVNESEFPNDALRLNEDILNKIHNSLFSGQKLTLDDIEILVLDLLLAKGSVEEYFQSIDNTFKGKAKKEIFNLGKMVNKELYYFGILIILVLIFGPYAFLLALFLGVSRHDKDKKDAKIEILKVQNEKDVHELFEEFKRRIANYEDILMLKRDRLKMQEESYNRTTDYYLVLVNDYLGLCLNDRITLLDVPSNIQQTMLIMLQNDLQTTGTLEELIGLAKAKMKGNIQERVRHL